MLIGGSASGSTLPVRQVIDAREGAVHLVDLVQHQPDEAVLALLFRIYANESRPGRAPSPTGSSEKEGVKRPAIIYNSNDYGVGGFQRSTRDLWSPTYNIKPVAAERYNPGDQDFSAQLCGSRRRIPTGCWSSRSRPRPASSSRQARELGDQGEAVRRRRDGDHPVPARRRAAAQRLRRGLSCCRTSRIPTSPPSVAYRNKLREWVYPGGLPPGRPSEYDLAAYAAGKVAEDGAAAIGPNPTREEFVDALETLRNFETGVAFPISYSKDNHEGTEQVLVIRVNKELKWEMHPAADPLADRRSGDPAATRRRIAPEPRPMDSSSRRSSSAA